MILAVEYFFALWGLGLLFAPFGEISDVYGVADAHGIKAAKLIVFDFGSERGSRGTMSVGQIDSCLGQVAGGLICVNGKLNSRENRLCSCSLNQAKKGQENKHSGHVHRISSIGQVPWAPAKLEIYL